ncbi:MAG: hypothetical protein V3V08_18745 [Nannocystaceae bacterium]
MKQTASAARRPFVSNLASGTERFLAHVIDHGLSSGHRRPEDFFRHFSSTAIMEALDGEPEIRARLLVETTGIKKKIALRKTSAAAGVDLQLAFDENEADSDAVLQIFGPDERVRFLDPASLWAYVCEGDFWDARDDEGRKALSGDLIGVIISRALEEELIDHRAVIEPLGIERLVRSLPGKIITRVLERALSEGGGGDPFSHESFLAVATVGKLVEHLPLSVLWKEVVAPCIARPCGLERGADTSAPSEASTGKKTADTTKQATASLTKAETAAPTATNGAGNGKSTARMASGVTASTGVPAATKSGRKAALSAKSAAAKKGGASKSDAASKGKTTSPRSGGPGSGAAGGSLAMNDDVFKDLSSDELLVEEVTADGDIDVIDEVLDDLGRTL